MLKKILPTLEFLGINLRTTKANTVGLKWFYDDLKEIRAQLKSSPDFQITRVRPILTDKTTESGTLSGHYFHQDLLVAKRVFLAAPTKHVDIGSRTDGFVAHVASFREIEVFDIRPLENKIGNINFVQADFMRPNEALFEYTDSISCLHAIEHFGLGRYNDPIDVNGHLKGLDTINKVLRKGGKFYFSTPIGPQRIEFNAHRVFGLAYLLKLLTPYYELVNFSYVDDAGDLHENVTLTEAMINSSCGCHYGCGIFELIKK
jgi:SAM-dependent methyltransferase